MTVSTNTETQPAPQCESNSNRLVRVRPHVDIVEGQDEFLMSVDLPGVAKTDLEVTLEKNILTIEGRTRFQAPDGFESLGDSFQDRFYERSFRLSDEIDRNQIQIETRNGVAVFKLPKSKESRKTKLTIK